MITVQ